MSDNLKSKIENVKWLGDSAARAGASGQRHSVRRKEAFDSSNHPQ
jgi:hypothetical protein